jgi:lipopolysaccharide export system permease protein
LIPRLDRYLFRQVALPFGAILFCLTAVVWLTQVLQRMDLIVEDGGSLLAFLRVTVLLIPSLLAAIIPFALVCGVLYGLNVLATDNELPVMGAAGASRVRIARPILFLSLIASAGVLAINLDLQPRSYKALKQTVQDVRSDIARSLIRAGTFTQVTDGIMVYAEEVRPGDQYVGLLIHDSRNPAETRTITASNALFRMTADGPRLLLLRGTAQRASPLTGEVEVAPFMEGSLSLATFEQDGTAPERAIEASERTLTELWNPDLSKSYDALLAGSFAAEGHARLATSLYPVAFALIAAAVLLPAPIARRGQASRVALAIVLALGARTLGYLVQAAAAEAPRLNPVQYAVPILAIIMAMTFLLGPQVSAPRRTVSAGLFARGASA